MSGQKSYVRLLDRDRQFRIVRTARLSCRSLHTERQRTSRLTLRREDVD